MKKILLGFIALALCLFTLRAHAQNDTIYFMKDGVVVNQQSIISKDVDSAIFYNPIPTGTTNNSATIDVDGNVYKSVTIGIQEWMVENLRTTKYADGTAIHNVTNNSSWGSLNTGAWSHYDNDSQHESTYGKLYNWYAASDSRNLCPTGWHVPTDADWTLLTKYLAANGYNGKEGTALKSNSGWNSNGNGTDNYLWLGFPGGFRSFSGYFDGVGYDGYWWSSLESNASNAWFRYLDTNNGLVSKANYYKRYGFSVRCLRD